MLLKSLFFTTTRGDNAVAGVLTEDRAPQKQKAVPTLATLESLTYPIAVAIVTAATLALRFFAGSWADAPVLAFVIAVLYVGAFVANGWSDFADGGKRVAAVVIALINSLIIAAVAEGAEQVVKALQGTLPGTGTIP